MSYLSTYYSGNLLTEFGTRVVANLLERGWTSDNDTPFPSLTSPDGKDPEEAEAEILKAKIESVRP